MNALRFFVPNENSSGYAYVFLGVDVGVHYNHGQIAIISDFGNYSYAWGGIPKGTDFRQFLLDCDTSYLTRKFSSEREYDPKATLKTVKENILQRRRWEKTESGKTRAREEWELLRDYNNLDTEHDIREWAGATTLDVIDVWCSKTPEQVVGFFEVTWPRIRKALELSLLKPPETTIEQLRAENERVERATEKATRLWAEHFEARCRLERQVAALEKENGELMASLAATVEAEKDRAFERNTKPD